jgi:excisionase family DNA binding protein
MPSRRALVLVGGEGGKARSWGADPFPDCKETCVPEEEDGRELSLSEPQEWPELLVPREVASLLRFSVSRVTKWCQSGQLAGAARIGSQWRVPRAAVWRMLPSEILQSWGEGPWETILREREADAPGGREA